MKRILLSLLCAAAGIASGWLAGQSRTPAAAEESAGTPAASRARSKDRGTERESSLPMDFASYVKRVAKPAETESAEQAAGRMSKEELREFLLSLPDMDWRNFTRQDFLLYGAGNAIAAELFRREGVAALDWAFAAGKKPACEALLTAAHAADPKRVGPYNVKFFTTFDGGTGWGFTAAGVNAAAMRGADDLAEVVKLWKSSGGIDSIPAFAPGFDFTAFFAKCEPGEHILSTPLAAWIGQDADAAGKAIARGLREGQRWEDVLDDALQARALLAGESEAARWMASIIKEVSGENRTMAVSRLANDITAARANALIAELPTDGDRIDLFIGTMYRDYDGTGISLGILQAMPSEEIRLQALSRLYAGKSRIPNNLGTREARIRHLETVAPKLGLSEAARQQLLSAIPAE